MFLLPVQDRRGRAVLSAGYRQKYVWEEILPSKPEPWISVWKMSPWNLTNFPLVLIESHEPEDQEFPFMMGVMTPEEYESLTRELDEVLYDLACTRTARRRRYDPERMDRSR